MDGLNGPPGSPGPVGPQGPDGPPGENVSSPFKTYFASSNFAHTYDEKNGQMNNPTNILSLFILKFHSP